MKLESETIFQQYLVKDKLELYLREVSAANRKFNLFSRNFGQKDLKALIAESLLPLEMGWIDINAGPILDIGSGWGIPSLPLLMTGRAFNITLVERSQKKADFLLLLLHRLGLKADVINNELSELSNSKKYSLVLMRRVRIDEKIILSMKRLTEKSASLVYFGKDLPIDSFKSQQIIDYTTDGGDSRRVIKAGII